MFVCVWGVRLCVYVCVCRRCAPVCEMCLCVCEMCVRVWDVRLCVRCVASCMCAPVRVSVWVRVRYLHDLRQAGILLGGEQAGVQVAAVAVCVRVIRRVCREEAHVQPSTPTLWIKHICVSWMQWWQTKMSICKIKLFFFTRSVRQMVFHAADKPNRTTLTMIIHRTINFIAVLVFKKFHGNPLIQLN
jgi:hypothetical protein